MDIQTPISDSELGPSIPTALNKRNLNLTIKIIIGVAVVAIITGGTFLVIRIWKPSPEKVIKKMSVEMEKVKAFHCSAKVDINLTKDWKISMVSSIDLDETDPQNLKSAGDFGFVLDIAGEQYSLKGEYKEIGELAFLRLDKIPLFYSLFVDLSKIENRWIKIEETESLDGLEGEVQKQKETTKTLKDRLSDKELYIVKKELADEKIGDINTHHYLVNLEKEKIKEVILLGSPETSETIISLIEARIKYKNTVIAADLSGMRAGAELIAYYNDDSYANVNCQNQEIRNNCDSIKEISGSEPIIFTSTDEYCAYVPVTEGYYVCIDSLGSLITTKVFPETSGYCNGRTFVCPKGIGVGVSIPEEDRKKAAEEEFSRMLEKAGEINTEIWIGKEDNYLYKFKLGGEDNDFIKLEVEFSNFNKPIDIKEPTDYKSLEELLAEEEISEKQSEEMMPEDETGDWKTYRNEEYGYEIKYPPDYAIMNESGSEVVFAPQQAIQYEEDEDYFWSLGITLVEVNDNPNDLSIEDFYDGDPGYNYFGKGGAISFDYPYSEQVQTDIIGGKEVIVISPAGTYGIEYYILSSFDGRLLRIHNRDLPYETSKLMFETFRFLE